MKIKLLTLLLAFGSMAMAQSLSIARIDTSSCKNSNANSTDELIGYLDITNNSADTLDILCKRIDKNYNGLTDSNAICWGGQCWLPSVSVSPLPETLAPGQTSAASDFSSHVYPDGDGNYHRGPITYVFFDANNPTDSLAYTIYYEVGVKISLDEKAFEEFSVYPNPARDVLNVQYSGKKGENTSFELVNMVGKKVYSRNLSNDADQLKLDISSLSRGVYFYIVKSDGQVTSSKKLVIR